jgi:hypothetical protein
MAHGQSPAGDRGQSAGSAPAGRTAAAPAQTVRVVLAAALVVVVLAGVRVAVPSARWDDGAWHGHGIPLGIGVELALLALLTAVVLRYRRAGDVGQPAAGLRALLRVVLLVGAIAIPVLMLADAIGKLKPRRPHSITPPAKLHLPTQRPHGAPAHGVSSGDLALGLYVLLAVVALAAIVICVVLLRRRTGDDFDDEGEFDEGQDEEQLRRAVESGQAALREIDDARLAIIACYAAMELSLARAGAKRGAAETPDELLDRAAAAGLAPGGEAGRLTALFYEARFSTHPLAPERRDEARRALAALAVSLPDAARTTS